MVSLIAMGLMLVASSRVVRVGAMVLTGAKVWKWREGERAHRLGVNRTVKKRYRKEKTSLEKMGFEGQAKDFFLSKLVNNELHDTTYQRIEVRKKALPPAMRFVPRELIITRVEYERFVHETKRFLRGERRPDPLLAIEEIVDFSKERKKDRRAMAQVQLVELQN